MSVELFLMGMARLVRKRVTSGRAIHATLATADELELLAQLPWAECHVTFGASAPDGMQGKTLPVQPADLALGWMMASRCVVDCQNGGGLRIVPAEVERAAVSSELAYLSGVYGWENAACAAGAREAWNFVVAHLGMRLVGTSRGAGQTTIAAMWNAYHREVDQIRDVLSVRSSAGSTEGDPQIYAGRAISNEELLAAAGQAPKEMTLQGVLDALKVLSPEQLANKAIWFGDERGGYIHAVEIVAEDQVSPDGQGWEPRAAFIKRAVEEEGETREAAEAEPIVAFRGQPLLCVD